VTRSLSLQALCDPQLVHQIYCVLLEQTGTHTCLDVGPVARLEHDGFDALALQQQRQRQPGWARADDCNLGSQLKLLAIGFVSGGPAS
jgi:hypothetical protein